MTYEVMYEITKYCKNNGIELDRETIKLLIHLDSSSFDVKVFPLLRFKNELLKKLLKIYIEFAKELSPLFKRVDIDFEEIVSILILISKQSASCRSVICKAVCNDKIRNDKEKLNLIASQDNWRKAEEMYLACENDAIRQDLEALRLIANQNEAVFMYYMRLACENAAIREDKEVLKLIASGDTVGYMEIMLNACKNDAIREDKVALNLIAVQGILSEDGDFNRMIQMFLACNNNTIRENKELLNKIARLSSWQEMEQMRLNYTPDERERLREYEIIKTEAETRDEQSEQLRDLLLSGKIEEFQTLYLESSDLTADESISRAYL